ncbi:MAG: hypothetical protein GTN38_04770 [Candidatus Aenigmarchaeota archaeon]|nr:hypothetical protein [Candidatus Aenigmarchaeota archaeon]NIP41060.1 hypothetical protein [Candidatus Aenigmarchaeota archaeon]NIQ17462.1 hypothetical protein [Candidatus Aenigmarchaeota archaeon]NIS73656.1 hypothetical protein [Candidatus Aenigmarchaeota archaeon]
MKAVFFIPSENYSKAKNLVYSDDLVSRQSINFRESKALGLKKEGYYLEIDGSEEAIKKLAELLKDLGKEVDKKEKEEVLKKISEQEESAAAGFGSIFG